MEPGVDPDETVFEITLDQESEIENESDYVPNSDQEEVAMEEEESVNADIRRIAAQLQDWDSPSDEDFEVSNFSDEENDDISVEVEYDNDNVIAPNQNLYPDEPMKLVQPPAEYDADFVNGWVQLEETDPGHPDGHPPFTGQRSTTVQGLAPMDFFNFLFKDAMWGELAMQTNDYAQRRLEQLGPDAVARMDNPGFKIHARLNYWKPVTAVDMRVFAAHLILLGLVKKPDLEEYWSRKTLTRTPFFGRYMSRDRFQMILSNFHLVDDSNNPKPKQPGHKPLAKLQPMIDMIGTAFKSAYKPGKNISIDEGCCPWKGRLAFRMFNPRKPAKFHIKLFQVSDPATGYVVHFSIYTGKGSCHEEGNTSSDSDNSVTTKTVMTLCADAGILDKGHHVYFDNYFTSPQLLKELYSRDTLACGTARSRTFGPQALQSTKPKLALSPGESCALRCGPILAFKWVEDKAKAKKKPKQVYMMTTVHTGLQRFTGKLCRDDNAPILKPVAIVDYTKWMGGVDLSDQIMNYYHFLRRGCKWWRKLWVHLFNMVIANGHVLNKTFGLNNKLTHQEYRYVIAAALLDFQELDEAVGPPGVSLIPATNNGHWPQRLPKSNKTGKTKTRKCKFCHVSANMAVKTQIPRNEKSTTIICKACKVPLCVDPCFEEYHKRIVLNERV